MATATQSTMSIEMFHASKNYLSLTSGQKKWINFYIATSDANRATREAYGSTDEAYIAMFTRKIESSPRIIAALDLFYGRTPKEKFLRDLELDIARAKGVAKIEARRLFAKVAGLDGSESASAAEMRIPEGATAWYDKTTGVVIGYRTLDGKDVQL